LSSFQISHGSPVLFPLLSQEGFRGFNEAGMQTVQEIIEVVRSQLFKKEGCYDVDSNSLNLNSETITQRPL